VAKSRQFEKAGRWIAFEETSGMLWTLEGNVPRQGVTDYGDTKANKHVGEAKIQAAIDKLSAARLKDGWTETAVGWAEATAVAPAAAAPKPVKIAIPSDKLATPAKPPANIAKVRKALADQVTATASKAKLAPWSKIAPLVRDSVSVSLTPFKGVPPLGASRIGGAPDLDAGATWPKTTRPLELVAQLRLDEIAPFDSDGILPKTGLLLLFADLSPSSSRYLEDGTFVHVAKLTTIARRPPPDGVAMLQESAVSLAPAISLPPADGAFIAKAKLSENDRETYNDRVLLPALAKTKHQILGYPTLTEVEAAKADEHCILQLASDTKRKLSFGDGQTLRFYLRGKRLRVTAEEI